MEQILKQSTTGSKLGAMNFKAILVVLKEHLDFVAIVMTPEVLSVFLILDMTSTSIY